LYSGLDWIPSQLELELISRVKQLRSIDQFKPSDQIIVVNKIIPHAGIEPPALGEITWILR
jgi:hypothetical protein